MTFCIHDDHADGSRAWIATTATISVQLNFIKQLRHGAGLCTPLPRVKLRPPIEFL